MNGKNDQSIRLDREIEGSQEMDVYQLFGATVKQLREKQGLSKNKLAGICGIVNVQLTRIERGERCTLGTAQRIAHGLGAELNELL